MFFLCVLMTLSVAKISIGDRWMNVEHWQNDNNSTNHGTWRILFPSATFPTTNPTWIGLGSNPNLHGDRVAANCLNHGMNYLSCRSLCFMCWSTIILSTCYTTYIVSHVNLVSKCHMWNVHRKSKYLCNKWMKGGCLRKEENCNISFAMLEFQGEKVFL